MTYVRSKMINGCGPYYYEVRSVREGKTVRQVFVKYIGKHPGRTPSDSVVPKEQPKAYLEVDGAEDRKIPKTWDKARRRRAEMIARVTKSNPFQADGLAKIAWRSGADPDKVNWDELQGADLSYDEKVEKLENMMGSSAKTEKEYALAEDQWLEDQADRRRYRESVEA